MIADSISSAGEFAATQTGAKTVDIVMPAFNEAAAAPLIRDWLVELRRSNPAYVVGLIVVDDGSTDGTSAAIAAALDGIDRIEIIKLTRNFGSHIAISAGIARSNADAIIFLSSDFQEPSSVVGDMLREWEAGSSVVWGVPKVSGVSRSYPYRVGSSLFYRMMHAGLPAGSMPDSGASVFLISRRVASSIRERREHDRNIFGLIAWLSYPSSSVEYDQESRKVGTSKWTFAKRVKLAVDSTLSFSSMTATFVLYLSISYLVLAVILGVGCVYEAITDSNSALIWLVLFVVVISSALLFVVLAMLLAVTQRSLTESRMRPLFAVEYVETTP